MMSKSKKAMVNQLSAIAFGIIGLIVVVGIGLVVLGHLEGSVGTCAAGYTFNYTQGYCVNSTYGDPTAPTGGAATSIAYGITQLGSTGLLSWLPAVIALLIGVFFLSYFAGKKSSGH